MGEKKIKWDVSGLLLASLAIIMLAFFVTLSIINNIYAQAVSNISQQIDMICKETSTYLAQKQHTALALADSAALYLHGSADTTGYQHVAERLKPYVADQVFGGIGVADVGGKLYSADGKTYDIGDDPSYRQALAGAPVISRPTTSRATGEQIILYCVPVEWEGEILGVVCASQPVNVFTQILSRDFYHGKGYCHIIADDGTLLVRSGRGDTDTSVINLFDKIAADSRDPARTDTLLTQIRNDFASETKGIVEAPLATQDRLIGYAALETEPDWNIVCVIRKEDIWEVSAQLVYQVLALTAGAIVILVLLVVFLSLTRRNARARLERAAYVDEVTGGNNYNAFRQQVPLILAAHKERDYLMICLDIDLFKTFNNSFGHAMGDALLRQLYTRLLLFCRQADKHGQDQIAARINGDGFVLLCHDIPTHRNMEALCADLAKASTDIGVEYTLKFNVGVYQIEAHDEPFEDMIDKAQLAEHYYAQNKLEHSYYYNKTLMEEANADSAMEAAMHAALAKGEFELWIQPKVDVITQRAVGAEALVRWQSGLFGLMMPARFIPLFERNGFVREVDFYLLDQVCRRLKAQLERGEKIVPVSLNQSRHHSYSPYYLEQLRQAVDCYQIDHDLIEFEVTESMLMENMEKMTANIRAIREMGFRVAIDDFGAGYTSLSFLQDVDVDEIKIDRSLVLGAQQKEKNRTMLRHLVVMSHDLGMKVVCEGVETSEQLVMAQQLGADVIQGFYYARPMPWADFLDYLARHS